METVMLAMEHAGRSQEHLQQHQGIFQRPTLPRTSRNSICQHWSCTVTTTRSFQSKTHRRNRPSSSKVLQGLLGRARKSHVSPFDIALIYTALGDKDTAFAWLAKAVAERSTWLVTASGSRGSIL